MTNRFKIKKGFTLIETLVAVLLLTTAVAGPLTIAARGLYASITARNQITAFYLAQDAVEYVRFARDSNKIAGGSWLAGLVGPGLCSSDGSISCQVDPLNASVAACSGTCSVFNYHATKHYFSYTEGTPTSQQFIRTVTITTPVGGNASEASLVVKVSWVDLSGATHPPITVREELFDWQ